MVAFPATAREATGNVRLRLAWYPRYLWGTRKKQPIAPRISKGRRAAIILQIITNRSIEPPTLKSSGQSQSSELEVETGFDRWTQTHSLLRAWICLTCWEPHEWRLLR